MRRALGVILVLTACAALAACSHGQAAHPDPAACRSAMKAAFARALASPSASPAGEPAACKGVPQATISQFATQIMGGN